MLDLEELLLDKNKLRTIPALVGQFSKLKHLDASFNMLESVSEELGNCVNLVDLTLSSNDLKVRKQLECFGCCWYVETDKICPIQDSTNAG